MENLRDRVGGVENRVWERVDGRIRWSVSDRVGERIWECVNWSIWRRIWERIRDLVRERRGR